MIRATVRPTLLVLLAVLAASACGASDDDGAGAGAPDRPTVVVSTSILGDVVAELAGDQVEVTVLIEAGVDPHDFQLSARDAAAMRDAELIVVNGAGFEEGLEDAVEDAAADGVPVVEAIAGVETLPLENGEPDPHFFTDPVRMIAAARGLVEAIADHVDDIDTDALARSTSAYISELEQLDRDITATLATLDDDERVLVTNHDVYAYFADRYGFEIVGTVLPAGSGDEVGTAQQLAALATLIRTRDVPAIFADTSAPDRLARALATEVGGDVEVVELHSESLGLAGSDADTYLSMMRANAGRIAAALARP